MPSLKQAVNPADSLAGESRTLPDSASTAALIRAANHHDDQSTIAPGEGNRIPKRSLPIDRGPAIGQPDAVNPLGCHWGESAGGGDSRP